MVPLLLVHPTVTTTALAPFTCREIGDHSYLEAAFAWRCDATAVVVARWLLGLPMLLAYTVGIPLTYYMLLRRQQEHLHTRLRATYGFLIAGFRRDRWFWELWNTLRKALFTASAVLLGPVGVKMQTWAALGLLFLFFVIFSNGRPYDRPVLNQLEMTALGVDVWQLLCGLGLFLSPDAATSELFTWMIVLVNIGFVAQFLSYLWRHGEALRCGRLAGARVGLVKVAPKGAPGSKASSAAPVTAELKHWGKSPAQPSVPTAGGTAALAADTPPARGSQQAKEVHL